MFLQKRGSRTHVPRLCIAEPQSILPKNRLSCSIFLPCTDIYGSQSCIPIRTQADTVQGPDPLEVVRACFCLEPGHALSSDPPPSWRVLTPEVLANTERLWHSFFRGGEGLLLPSSPAMP